MSAEMFGLKFFYIEAGSGADKPIPPEMVAYSKKATDNMIIVVGGGIRDARAGFGVGKGFAFYADGRGGGRLAGP